MSKDKFIISCCILLFVCIGLGGVLITLANYVPVNSEIKKKSLEEVESEGLFPEVPSMEGGYGNFHSTNPTTLELASDAAMLKMAFYEGEGSGIEQAFRCYNLQFEVEYSRYWHGYVTVLRPLLLFFDYYELRILNGFCQVFLLAVVFFTIRKLRNMKYALAVFTSYLMLMPMALSQCILYSCIFYISFGILLIYVKWRNFWDKGNRYVYLFIVAGVMTVYFDLLTYPLLTWGLLIVWMTLLQKNDINISKRKQVLKYLWQVVISGVAWIFGYGGMWVGKWALGSVVLQENLFKKALSEVLLWTVNEGEEAISLWDRLYSVYKNWSIYDYKIYMIILAAWLIYWAFRGIVCGYRRNAKAPALLLVAVSSVVWYMVLSGHSLMHHIFTYRTFSVSIAAFLGLLLLSTESRFEWVRKPKLFIVRIGLLIGTCVFSVLGVYLLRDEYLVHNGTYSNFTIVEMDRTVSMDFVPGYSEMKSLYLGFSVENETEGSCKVQLSSGGSVLEEIELQLSKYATGNMQKIDVDWKLGAGQPYKLHIEPRDVKGVVYLWVTSDGILPLDEFGEAYMGEDALGGQMLAGVTYWCTPQVKTIRVLFALTFTGICMMLLYACWSVAGEKGCCEKMEKAK